MTNRSFYISTSHQLASYIEQELNMLRGRHFRFVKVVPSYKVLTLWLDINPTYSKRVMAMTKELSQAARLPKGFFIRAEWGGQGIVELQIPKPKYLWAAPQVTKLPKRSGVRTAVGFDTENRAAWADFANPITAHCLIAGLSGCGKTNLSRVLAYMLAMQNKPEEVQLLLFDVADAGAAWNGFGDLPHLLHGVIADIPTALNAIDWLESEIEQRTREGRVEPRLFVFIDEVQELAQDKRFVEPLEGMAQRSRKWGLNLIAATQRPTKDSVPTPVKANMGLRLVGKVTGGQEAAWATDLPETGAETLCEAGDFLLIKGSDIERVAIPFLTDEDLARLPPNGDLNRLDFRPQLDDSDLGETDSQILAKLIREMQAEPGFDALETVVAVLAAHHGKGRPWLKDALEWQGRNRPGSGRARRLLAWGKKINDLLHLCRHRLALTA